MFRQKFYVGINDLHSCQEYRQEVYDKILEKRSKSFFPNRKVYPQNLREYLFLLSGFLLGLIILYIFL